MLLLMRYLFLVLFFQTLLHGQEKQTITGKVTDAETGLPIPYCVVMLSDYRGGATTDESGNFAIELRTADGRSKLVARCVGYRPDTLSVDFSRRSYTFALHADIKPMSEVVVTGLILSDEANEDPLAHATVPSKLIEQTNTNNIIDVLVRNVPGLEAVKTGPNISKPFIRGLGYNRVLTLYDGVRQEGQQWGDEHGLEVDSYHIERADVIKGPASLMAGSDALAGVVSLQSPVPNELDGIVRGKFLSEYQGNNGLVGDGLEIDYSDHLWQLSARGSFRLARSYQNSIDGRVYNTGFQEANGSGLVGVISDRGYSRMIFSVYDDLQEIPDGSRDSVTRRFTGQVAEIPFDDIKNRPIVPDNVLNSYQINALHQHIQHLRAISENRYQLRFGEIEALVGYQENVRREFDHPTDPGQAGLYVQLQTVNYGLRCSVSNTWNLQTTVGVNGMYQMNTNKDATDFPIPDYHLFDIGSYAFMEWKSDGWVVSGGLRYDIRTLQTDALYLQPNRTNGFYYRAAPSDTAGATLQFASMERAFNGISLSVGATYAFGNDLSVRANIARGYRAPNMTELASNGLDPGAHIVYLGNSSFAPEFNLQEDVGLAADEQDLSASVSGFNNSIENYIYLAQALDAAGNPVVVVSGNRTFRYQQSSAQLFGMEATLGLHPAAWGGLTVDNAFEMVFGYNRNARYAGKGVEGEYLPFIPPMKLRSGVQQEVSTGSGVMPTVTARGELELAARQDRYLGLDNTETPTSGYALVNLLFSADLRNTFTSVTELQLGVNNLFDAAYQSNLDRLKYEEYYTSSPNGHLGIYEMGRNAFVKVILHL